MLCIVHAAVSHGMQRVSLLEFSAFNIYLDPVAVCLIRLVFKLHPRWYSSVGTKPSLATRRILCLVSNTGLSETERRCGYLERLVFKLLPFFVSSNQADISIVLFCCCSHEISYNIHVLGPCCCQEGQIEFCCSCLLS